MIYLCQNLNIYSLIKQEDMNKPLTSSYIYSIITHHIPLSIIDIGYIKTALETNILLDSQKNMFLMTYCSQPYIHKEVIQLFIDNGVDVNYYMAGQSFMHKVIANESGEYLDIVKMFIDNGANPLTISNICPRIKHTKYYSSIDSEYHMHHYKGRVESLYDLAKRYSKYNIALYLQDAEFKHQYSKYIEYTSESIHQISKRFRNLVNIVDLNQKSIHRFGSRIESLEQRVYASNNKHPLSVVQNNNEADNKPTDNGYPLEDRLAYLEKQVIYLQNYIYNMPSYIS